MTHFSLLLLSCLELSSTLQRLTVETAQGPVEFRKISAINLKWLETALASRVSRSGPEDEQSDVMSASVRFYEHLRALLTPEQFGHDRLEVFEFGSPDDLLDSDEQLERVRLACGQEMSAFAINREIEISESPDQSA